MTVQNFVPLSVVPGVGTAGLVIPIPSNFYKDADIKVFRLSIDLVTGARAQALLALGTDYTITKTRVAGSRPATYTGSISVIGIVTILQKIAILIRPENEQIAALSSVPFDPSTYEGLFDLASMRDAALLEIIKRCFRLPLDSDAPQPIVAPQSGYVLGWLGNALVNLSPSQVVGLTTSEAIFGAQYDFWFRSLPPSNPGFPGAYWNDGGVLAQVQNADGSAPAPYPLLSGFGAQYDAWFRSLPKAMPNVIYAYWNNGGELAQVQP